NQLTNFCERILNKNLYEGNKGTHFLYVIAWNLAKIGDDYKYLCGWLSSSTAPDAKVLLYLEEINNHFKAYYELFYQFNPAILAELSRKREELHKKITETLSKKGQIDSVAIFYITSILFKCEYFSASMYMTAHKDKR
ncbi:hypothetical protein HY501_01740, partial [Candidatus Woesearchaeota archaeon]|nr:hypothetical protein [Candidatus Woesearchaeota archaeon]